MAHTSIRIRAGSQELSAWNVRSGSLTASECVMEVAFRRKEKKRATLGNQRSRAEVGPEEDHPAEVRLAEVWVAEIETCFRVLPPL